MFHSMQRRITARVLGGLLAGMAFLAAPLGERSASAADVEVRIAPPAAPVETRPRHRPPHHVWQSGYWAWNGHRHVWVQGHYVPERRGYAWRQPRWERTPRGNWHFHEGRWYSHR